MRASSRNSNVSEASYYEGVAKDRPAKTQLRGTASVALCSLPRLEWNALDEKQLRRVRYESLNQFESVLSFLCPSSTTTSVGLA
jgi:hypothetical protein